MSAPPDERKASDGHDWLLVDVTDPMYGDKVMAALTAIFGTASGRALLRRIYETGRVVKIEPPLPTQPPNAWVRSMGSPLTGPNRVVAYDASDWPSPAHPGSPTADVMLFALLCEAYRQFAAGTPSGAELDRSRPVYDTAEVIAYRGERGNV